MQVGASAGEFSARVYLHALGPADQPHQRTLGKHTTAADAGALGDMFGAFSRFASHFLVLTSSVTIRSSDFLRQPIDLTDVLAEAVRSR